MWKDSPVVVSVVKDQFGILDATVRFTNVPQADREIKFHGVESQDNLKQLIASQAAAWDKFDAGAAAIVPGPIDIKPTPPPDSEPPTPEEEARNAFVNALVRLTQTTRAVALGILQPNDALHVEALDAARAAFKAEYLGVL